MKPSKKFEVLVAGGAGFVGSHLCGYLVKRGIRVIALDNLITGSKKNFKQLLRSPNFKFIKGDVTEPAGYLKQVKNVSEIYHLASPASPNAYQKNPIATWKANTLGTLNLLELAKKRGAKILFASTSEIYGDAKEHPQKESYWGNVNPAGVRSCYDESKRAGEALCADFVRMHKVDVRVIRIFNTYGPNMDANDGRVVSNFIVQALNNRPISVYGNGRQTRSFQYIDDLLHGMLKVMSKKNFSGPVNLGNPREFTILRLAELVIKLAKSKSKIIYKKLPQDDPKQRCPDISLAKKALGWRPEVSLEAGLKKTILFFKRGKRNA